MRYLYLIQVLLIGIVLSSTVGVEKEEGYGRSYGGVFRGRHGSSKNEREEKILRVPHSQYHSNHELQPSYGKSSHNPSYGGLPYNKPSHGALEKSSHGQLHKPLYGPSLKSSHGPSQKHTQKPSYGLLEKPSHGSSQKPLHEKPLYGAYSKSVQKPSYGARDKLSRGSSYGLPHNKPSHGPLEKPSHGQSQKPLYGPSLKLSHTQSQKPSHLPSQKHTQKPSYGAPTQDKPSRGYYGLPHGKLIDKSIEYSSIKPSYGQPSYHEKPSHKPKHKPSHEKPYATEHRVDKSRGGPHKDSHGPNKHIQNLKEKDHPFYGLINNDHTFDMFRKEKAHKPGRTGYGRHHGTDKHDRDDSNYLIEDLSDHPHQRHGEERHRINRDNNTAVMNSHANSTTNAHHEQLNQSEDTHGNDVDVDELTDVVADEEESDPVNKGTQPQPEPIQTVTETDSPNSPVVSNSNNTVTLSESEY